MKSIHKIQKCQLPSSYSTVCYLEMQQLFVCRLKNSLEKQRVTSVGGIFLRENKNINSEAGNPCWKGRISTVDLLVITSSDYLILLQTCFFLYCKTSCLSEEVNCTELSPYVRIPCSRYQKCLGARAVVITVTDLGAML